MSSFSALSAILEETASVFAGPGYSLFKIEAHAVCIAVLVILLYRQQNSSDQTEQSIAWSRLLVVQIMYCAAGIVRVFADVGILPRTYVSRYIAAMFTFGLFGAMCWLVFVYMELCQHSELVRTKRGRVIIALPFVFNIGMMAVSGFFPGVLADFSGRTFTRGALYPAMTAVNYAYPLASVILSLRRRARKKLRETDPVPVLVTFPALLIVCGAVQEIYWRIPFLCYMIVIMDIQVSISYADSLVSIDPMTKIPNRNALMRELSERFSRGNLETLHLFAVDVDEMGRINSSYGRSEGDRALIMMAGALKKFSREEHKCGIFRYYEDEFMLLADINDDEERELFTEHIRNYISNAAMAAKFPFWLRVTAGWAKYEQYSKTETIPGLIDEAERAVIENREQKEFRNVWQNL